MNLKNITFHLNGVEALKDSSIIIGAKKHWYSTENIILNGKYERNLINKYLLFKKYNDIRLKIRYANHIITNIYLQPSKSITDYYKTKQIINYPYISIHLRIGDVDNLPYNKYLNKSEVFECLNYIKAINNLTEYVSVVSDSVSTKSMFKQSLKNVIITNTIPCHSKNKNCIFQAIIDILILKYSNKLILTRGSTFSLFGMYQNNNCMNNNLISFIGHDYEHNNYYN